MQIIKPMLVLQMQASALLGAVNNNNGAVKSATTFSANLNETGKNILSEHLVKCYVPTDKIGSSRVIDTLTATDILNHAVHIDQSYYLDYLRGLPLKELENMMIRVEILPYKNQDMAEPLLEAMLFNTLLLRGSHSGKMDWNCFEKKLHRALPDGCAISDFIDGKKYFTPSLLNINPRYLTTGKGANHED